MAVLAARQRANMWNKVPEVTLAFWIIKIMATTVGETGADYLAVHAGLGTAVTGGIMAGQRIAGCGGPGLGRDRGGARPGGRASHRTLASLEPCGLEGCPATPARRAIPETRRSGGGRRRQHSRRRAPREEVQSRGALGAASQTRRLRLPHPAADSGGCAGLCRHPLGRSDTRRLAGRRHAAPPRGERSGAVLRKSIRVQPDNFGRPCRLARGDPWRGIRAE